VAAQEPLAEGGAGGHGLPGVLMVSMPSARTTASVRSAWARTLLTMWAASAVVRPRSSRMSSLIGSGRTNGSTARLAGAAPNRAAGDSRAEPIGPLASAS
jgi:hypothetical protein